MAMMRKAQRRKAKLRLGLSGPAGSGKTFGALLVAYGIAGVWEDICLIDSENYSGDLYANYNKNGIAIGEYNVISLAAPYTPEKYIAAIKECEAAGIKCVIIDSLTHAWAGVGGLLDKKGQIEKKTGNGWTAWRDVTPMHNNLVDAILSSTCHIIATLRAKMEHVQEKDPSTGKTVIRKIGMNPIQRDGMEYEFTTFIDIDQDHQCTSSKDRTSIVDGRVFQLSSDLGTLLLQWLDSGVDTPPPTPVEQPKPHLSAESQTTRKTLFASLGNVADEMGVDKPFAEERAKAIIYHVMNVKSLSELDDTKWVIVKRDMTKIVNMVKAAITKSLTPSEGHTA